MDAVRFPDIAHALNEPIKRLLITRIERRNKKAVNTQQSAIYIMISFIKETGHTKHIFFNQFIHEVLTWVEEKI